MGAPMLSDWLPPEQWRGFLLASGCAGYGLGVALLLRRARGERVPIWPALAEFTLAPIMGAVAWAVAAHFSLPPLALAAIAGTAGLIGPSLLLAMVIGWLRGKAGIGNGSGQ